MSESKLEKLEFEIKEVQKKAEEQEMVRRNIEVCMFVIKTANNDSAVELHKAAVMKASELLKKIG